MSKNKEKRNIFCGDTAKRNDIVICYACAEVVICR